MQPTHSQIRSIRGGTRMRSPLRRSRGWSTHWGKSAHCSPLQTSQRGIRTGLWWCICRGRSSHLGKPSQSSHRPSIQGGSGMFRCSRNRGHHSRLGTPSLSSRSTCNRGSICTLRQCTRPCRSSHGRNHQCSPLRCLDSILGSASRLRQRPCRKR